MDSATESTAYRGYCKEIFLLMSAFLPTVWQAVVRPYAQVTESLHTCTCASLYGSRVEASSFIVPSCVMGHRLRKPPMDRENGWVIRPVLVCTPFSFTPAMHDQPPLAFVEKLGRWSSRSSPLIPRVAYYDERARVTTVFIDPNSISNTERLSWVPGHLSSRFMRVCQRKPDMRSIGNSIISKVMERIIAEALKSHLEIHSLLSDKQHGFRQNRSCLSNLLVTLDDWTRAVDAGVTVHACYLDISKAFDRVDHSILLRKLEMYGVTGNLLSWLKDYLSDRSVQVRVDGAFSDKIAATSGVPQVLLHPRRTTTQCKKYDCKCGGAQRSDQECENRELPLSMFQQALDAARRSTTTGFGQIGTRKRAVLPAVKCLEKWVPLTKRFRDTAVEFQWLNRILFWSVLY
ncbi:hypothetical protein T265_07831 [Opisthorchis viverrini]|uniref:Reverse transcriptase domain-containing protein n=1 Tax=Opisthorchis viverrini TaxID=6198 RepID=A0A075AAC2_OPIVI|nr:hypothetical protein T265_07831 [Opisthorchis viverrini]KER24519.1 hypothetical protein T265_07831 [Opisthorchis viverrini]